jgi:NAD(P)-dependent dehydrogenase (short-subunit alcohol dehydrogenase family)
MDLVFAGRVAIVTGAGAGLGRAHALLLADRGARVVVNDLGGSVRGEGGGPAAAEAVVEEITARGGVAVADASTVATAEGGSAIVRTALDSFGRVDIIVNNAGIVREGAFHKLTPGMFDAVLDVHLKGALHVTRAAWPLLRDQRYGRVVNTTSAAGLLGMFGESNYATAKAGLVGLTRALAIEGARRNIKVNAIAPVARTRMSEDVLDGFEPDALDPGLVSPLVAWLAHEDCDASGEIFSAGGGRVARYFTAVTPGYFKPDLTPEDVREHLGDICREDDYSVPRSPADELTLIAEAVRGHAATPGRRSSRSRGRSAATS